MISLNNFIFLASADAVGVPAYIELAYLAAAVMFIFGLKMLSNPNTARRGNFISAIGMLVAVLATLISQKFDFTLILLGIVLGAGLGAWAARAVKMTAMPQLVGLLNGFGGAASALVAAAEWYRKSGGGTESIATDLGISIYASMLIGSVTFSGSLVASGKLHEVISGKPILFKGQHIASVLALAATLGIAVYLLTIGANLNAFIALTVLALIVGVLFTIPVGGADMPVVICLLNSYSGLAASMTGFVINNHGLIITGALVGASGLILTNIMCKAMNRSLANVMFAGVGATVAAPAAAAAGGRQVSVREVTPEDAAALLAYANMVVIVPGYGLAVAQAQHQVRELGDLLEKRGVDVKFGIHPVAGRMPGHMNVLLAEANVEYDKLFDMDAVNPQMERTDVALIVGANDVVNPAARNTPSSPLYGMPIIDVDKAKNIIFMKRSLNPGFAGVDNELFYNEKTSMLFGDAKASLTKLVTEMKQV